MTKLPNYLWQTMVLSSLSGMRSFSGVTLVAFMLNRRPSKNLQRSHLPFKYLQSPIAANTLAVLALGEFVGDKLPATPNRTDVVALVGRFAFGAFTGAALLKAKGGNSVSGLILGGACALTAAFASFYLRKAITGPNKLSNVAAGLIEDCLVLGIGTAIIAKIDGSRIK
jgi:uncharacterized membrane protein